MSLRSLLPIGRAFEPSGLREGRFRPAEPGLVPDFSRGPRADRGWDGGGEGETRREGEVGVCLSEAGVSAGEAASQPGPVRGESRVRRRLPSWLEQLILALIRPGNRRRRTREVQGEFRLESVKVAKNDLVTSDVEMVAISSSRPRGMSASCRARLLALWWSPVAKRLGRWGKRTDES